MKNSLKSAAQLFLSIACACLLPVLQGSVLTSAIQAHAQSPAPDSPAIEAKAQAMVARLTLDQKIQLLGGVDGMYTHPISDIALPRFKMSDASVGVRTWFRWPQPGTGISHAGSASRSAKTPALAASTFCSAQAST